MFQHMKEFAERPFNPEMNIWGWALFVLLIMIVAGLWASVINLLREI